jgi:hypothetical protein
MSKTQEQTPVDAELAQLESDVAAAKKKTEAAAAIVTRYHQTVVRLNGEMNNAKAHRRDLIAGAALAAIAGEVLKPPATCLDSELGLFSEVARWIAAELPRKRGDALLAESAQCQAEGFMLKRRSTLEYGRLKTMTKSILDELDPGTTFSVTNSRADKLKDEAGRKFRMAQNLQREAEQIMAEAAARMPTI